VPRLRNVADRFAQTWFLLELLRGLRIARLLRAFAESLSAET
jgi:hypothetical protein